MFNRRNTSTMKTAKRSAATTIALLTVSILTLTYHSTTVYWYTLLTLTLTLGPTPLGILCLAAKSAYPTAFSIGIDVGTFKGTWYKLLLDLAYIAPAGAAFLKSSEAILCYSLREFPGCETLNGILERIYHITSLGEDRDQWEVFLVISVLVLSMLIGTPILVYILLPAINPVHPLILAISLTLNLLTTYNFCTSIGRTIQHKVTC